MRQLAHQLMFERAGRTSLPTSSAFVCEFLTQDTSPLPTEHWHAYLNDPTLADTILDRVLHAAHKVALTGESLRKQENPS